MENIALDIKKVANNIKDRKAISISYLSRTYSMGYVKAANLFKTLVDEGYISDKGTVLIKCKEDNPGIKIVFLDVDGVLNSSSTKDTCGKYVGIEDEKVELLKKLVDETGARIVLVSTWKEYWYKEPFFKDKQDYLANYLDKKLDKYGLYAIDKTEDEVLNRGDGILEYIHHLKWKGIDVKKFVILDDELFDYLRTKLTKNLVQTSYNKGGLQLKHIRKAIEKLNSSLSIA